MRSVTLRPGCPGLALLTVTDGARNTQPELSKKAPEALVGKTGSGREDETHGREDRGEGETEQDGEGIVKGLEKEGKGEAGRGVKDRCKGSVWG